MLVAIVRREGVVGKRGDDDDIGVNLGDWRITSGLVGKGLFEPCYSLGDVLAANSIVVEVKVG